MAAPTPTAPTITKPSLDALRASNGDPVVAFTTAAVRPPDRHEDADCARADALRDQHGVGADVVTAAILGDAAALEALLSLDASSATRPCGALGWDPLTYLCFSKYAAGPSFAAAARVLLAHGASPNTGFYWQGDDTRSFFEAALYGAAALARNAELTRLLLEFGADPNDEETSYHVPEGGGNEVLDVLLASGKLSPESLTTLLAREIDVHDAEGIARVLAHGADPNRPSRWGSAALHHAISRGSSAAIVASLLDRGADPSGVAQGRSALVDAARAGRADLLALFAERGAPLALDGVDGLVAACATGDTAAIARLRGHAAELVASHPDTLVRFAWSGNAAGVGHLLDLGVAIGHRTKARTVYVDWPAGTTALHVAAWHARHDVVATLVGRGAPVDARDDEGRTPLALAARATVCRYWMSRRSLASVRALLAAGASPRGIAPVGWAEVDDLLRARSAS